METTKTRLHPLVATAAASVIVLSVTGVGAITGLLPKSGANADGFPPVAQSSATAPVPKARVATAPTYKYAVAPIGQAGVVESVRQVKANGQATWMGPVAGGVGGAVLGSQIGEGKTSTLLAVLGAAGGAYAGHEIEKRVRATTYWQVTARMDDGTTRSQRYSELPALREGDRVRHVDGKLQAEQRL